MSAYTLVDFGHGRRLERFGPWMIDRPCPTAEDMAPSQPSAWQAADARFARDDAQTGRWSLNLGLPDRWELPLGGYKFELKWAESGQVGVFPEQVENWRWIAERTAEVVATGPRPHVLNLFAYTGGSTLAAAAAGATVTHVDAARNVVAWARRNAEVSGLADAPTRWITEEAVKFCKRELARGNRYDAVILDPPSYGHGPRGEVWRLSKHLPRLLRLCAQLTAGQRRFMLVTAHTPGYEPERLTRMLAEAFADELSGPEAGAGRFEAFGLSLRTADGRELPSGAAARWQAT